MAQNHLFPLIHGEDIERTSALIVHPQIPSNSCVKTLVGLEEGRTIVSSLLQGTIEGLLNVHIAPIRLSPDVCFLNLPIGPIARRYRDDRTMVPSTSKNGEVGGDSVGVDASKQLPSSLTAMAVAASVSEKLVIRSLRRRLRTALMDEDSVSAIKIYTTTRNQWEDLICSEIATAEALETERQKQFAVAEAEEEERLKKRAGSGGNSITKRMIPRLKLLQKSQPQPQQPVQECFIPHELKTLQAMSQDFSSSLSDSNCFNENNWNEFREKCDAGNGSQGLLQIYMNPSEPFEPDDYKSPHDDYADENDDAPSGFGEEPRDVGGSSTKLLEKTRSFPFMKNRKNSNRTNSARQAFSFLSHRGHASEAAVPLFSVPSVFDTPTLSVDDEDNTTTNNNNGSADINHQDSVYENSHDITTPLHEAARIGCCDLVRLMLDTASSDQPSLDCNTRNGMGRTLLHCAAGGLTKRECIRYRIRQKNNLRTTIDNESAIDDNDGSILEGILVPEPLRLAPIAELKHTGDDPDAAHTTENLASTKARNMAKAAGRFFRDLNKNSTRSNKIGHDRNSGDHLTTVASEKDDAVEPLTDKQYDELQLARIDTAQTILSWSHPDDGSINAGIGVSPNAVDNQNRTALHYGAALGRVELCLSICNQFGTMLTIVDSLSQTPCELAGAHGWDDLAAQLEARAILYVDPYGTDEELLLSFNNSSSDYYGGNIGYSVAPAPPFFWFETLTLEGVRQRRERRVEQAFEKLQHMVSDLIQSETARNLVIDHCSSFEYANEVETEKNTAISVEKDVATKVGMEAESAESSSAKNGDNVPACPEPEVKATVFLAIDKLHVELYLTYHKWNVKSAMEAFHEDPFGAFEAANVPLPLYKHRSIPVSTADDSELNQSAVENMCLICCEVFEASSDEWKQLSGCEHGFCKECIGDYLADCAKSKSTGIVVRCPHHECQALLCLEDTQELSPCIVDISSSEKRPVLKMLQETADDNYVQSDPTLRFCPHPGCGSVVRFHAPSYAKSSKLTGTGLLELVGGVCTNVLGKEGDDDNVSSDSAQQVTYEGVRDPNYYGYSTQPRRAHRFCFQCGEVGIHWPIPCDRLREWNEVVHAEIKDVIDTGNGDDYNDVAQKLWMKANTRPCPKCNVPIQKDEGCNHMTCRNQLCQHEFCWICRKDWKLHSSETGGFFRCNRWVDEQDPTMDDENVPREATDIGRALANVDVNDPRTMEVTYGTSMYDTRAAKKKAKEMNRFLHHYQRWNAHAESARLERKMGESVCTRLAPVVREVVRLTGDDFILPRKGLSFVHAAFTELVECRSMLQHSYAISYFRYKPTGFRRYVQMRRRASEQMTFEQFQGELEIMTEQISDIVARSHIRASQTQIMFLTKAAAEKRKEFSNVMIKILFEEMQEKKSDLEDNLEITVGPRAFDLAGGMLDRIAASNNVDAQLDHETNVADLAVRRSLQQFLSRTRMNNTLMDMDDEEDIADWACQTCTYVNSGGRRCAMCGTRTRR